MEQRRFHDQGDGRNMNRVMIAKGGIAAYELTGTVELPQGAIALIGKRPNGRSNRTTSPSSSTSACAAAARTPTADFYLDAGKRCSPRSGSIRFCRILTPMSLPAHSCGSKRGNRMTFAPSV